MHRAIEIAPGTSNAFGEGFSGCVHDVPRGQVAFTRGMAQGGIQRSGLKSLFFNAVRVKIGVSNPSPSLFVIARP